MCSLYFVNLVGAYLLARCLQVRARQHSNSVCSSFYTNKTHMPLALPGALEWVKYARPVFREMGLVRPRHGFLEAHTPPSLEADLEAIEVMSSWLKRNTALLIIDASGMHYRTLIYIRHRLKLYYDAQSRVKTETRLGLPALLLIGKSCSPVRGPVRSTV
jgi:hypothetical protein